MVPLTSHRFTYKSEEMITHSWFSNTPNKSLGKAPANRSKFKGDAKKQSLRSAADLFIYFYQKNIRLGHSSYLKLHIALSNVSRVQIPLSPST